MIADAAGAGVAVQWTPNDVRSSVWAELTQLRFHRTQSNKLCTEFVIYLLLILNEHIRIPNGSGVDPIQWCIIGEREVSFIQME